MKIIKFIELALQEDVKDGDYSSLSCISESNKAKVKLLVKENGIIAGVNIAKEIFSYIDVNSNFKELISDGTKVNIGDIVFEVSGNSRKILIAERLVLNVMQRMSAISTLTNKYVERIKDTKAKILDTRKTTPLLRFLEKQAVKIGGGENHRMGLYDMIMLKDNHIDLAGGIKKAILQANLYIRENNLNLKIEIETRNLDEVNQVIQVGNVDRIMLDNFSYSDLRKAVNIINGIYETEASGGITLETIKEYALCGVDYISVGAITHSAKNMDLSLKAL
jgi:nicotinate-nucleotide pyrophosphorylase (carboxylating)